MCLVSTNLSANTIKESNPKLDSLEDELNYLAPNKSINIDSRLSLYMNDRGYGLRQSYVSISGEIEQELRAVVTLNIGHLFASGDLVHNPSKILEFKDLPMGLDMISNRSSLGKIAIKIGE